MVTKRGRIWLTRGMTIALVVVALGLFAATWYYSGEIARLVFGANRPGPAADVAVLEISTSTVKVPADERTTKPGQWGLALPDAYVRVGQIEASGNTVTRMVLAIEGAVASMDSAAWDRMAFSTPEARGIDYSSIVIEGTLGPLGAWRTDGGLDTWVVFVHGRGADRREALRAMPTAIAAGLPTLVVSYRNDADAPRSSSGRHGYGHNEWSDVHAAVEFARDEGARQVVLVGYGSGASIVSVFMRESSLATSVSALVFDSPVLDVEAVVDRFAALDQVPHFIVGWARAVATFRFGIEWDALDHLELAPDIAIPVLVFHGEDDVEAPIEASRQFVAALGDLASVVEVPGAGHGEAWNLDPGAYEDALGQFLEAVAHPLAEELAP